MKLRSYKLYKSLDEKSADLVLDFGIGQTTMRFKVGMSAKDISEMLFNFGTLLSKQESNALREPHAGNETTER